MQQEGIDFDHDDWTPEARNCYKVNILHII